MKFKISAIIASCILGINSISLGHLADNTSPTVSTQIAVVPTSATQPPKNIALPTVTPVPSDKPATAQTTIVLPVDQTPTAIHLPNPNPLPSDKTPTGIHLPNPNPPLDDNTPTGIHLPNPNPIGIHLPNPYPLLAPPTETTDKDKLPYGLWKNFGEIEKQHPGWNGWRKQKGKKDHDSDSDDQGQHKHRRYGKQERHGDGDKGWHGDKQHGDKGKNKWGGDKGEGKNEKQGNKGNNLTK